MISANIVFYRGERILYIYIYYSSNTGNGCVTERCVIEKSNFNYKVRLFFLYKMSLYMYAQFFIDVRRGCTIFNKLRYVNTDSFRLWVC